MVELVEPSCSPQSSVLRMTLLPAEAPEPACRAIVADQTAHARFAQECEAILLSYGLVEEAYTRYLREAHRLDPSPAAFLSVAERYRPRQPAEVLVALASGDPLGSARWFDAAVDLGEWDIARSFLGSGPTTSAGVLRAALAHSGTAPAFSLACALAAVKAMAQGAAFKTVRRERREFRAAVKRAAQRCPAGEPVLHEIHRFCGATAAGGLAPIALELLAALRDACADAELHLPSLDTVTQGLRNQDIDARWRQ